MADLRSVMRSVHYITIKHNTHYIAYIYIYAYTHTCVHAYMRARGHAGMHTLHYINDSTVQYHTYIHTYIHRYIDT